MKVALCFLITALASLLPPIDASISCLFNGKAYRRGDAFIFGEDECVCEPPRLVCRKPQENDPTQSNERNHPCISSPCLNGGKCQPFPDNEGFRCVCRFPYAGRNCKTCSQALPQIDLKSTRVVSPIPKKIRLFCNTENATTVAWSPLKDERFSDNEQGKLSIVQPREEDSGVYECTATNECGQSTAKIKLIIRANFECPPLKLPPKVNIVDNSYSREIGAVVNFECDIGNRMYGSATTQCGDDGQWTEYPPFCLPPDYACPSPEKPSNGRIITKKKVFKLGDRVDYDCNNGYTNVGNSYRVCEGENALKWSTPGPKCKPLPQNDVVSCGFPGEIKNGDMLVDSFDVDDSFTSGTLVRYKCNEGYYLQGARTIECKKNGQWSFPPPTCYPSVVEADDLISLVGLNPPCSICVNLTFVLDSSSSIRNKDFVLALDLISNLATTFDHCPDVRVSLIIYCDESYLEFNSLPLSALNDSLRDVDRCRGSTATRLAFDAVRDKILPDLPCRTPCDPIIDPTESGDGMFDPVYLYPCPCIELEKNCTPCKNLLFLITDGKSNWAGEPFHAANCLKDHGFEIFSIGIGPSVDVEELVKIASEPEHKHVLLATNYKKSVRLLNALRQRSKK